MSDIYCMEAGKNVTYDDDIGSRWRHLAVVREQDHLKLYLDGELRGTSTAFDPNDYDVANDKALLIGFGSRNYFKGAMDDLRIYKSKLSAEQIKDLFDRTHIQ